MQAADALPDPQESLRQISQGTESEARLVESLLANIDFDAYRAMQDRLVQQSSYRHKFLDIGRHVRTQYARAADLGLDGQARPSRVLDIGCGGGHFLLVCRHFGHNVMGLDIEAGRVFRDLIAFFDLPRELHTIKPYTPLPDMGRFDFITAFSANFHEKPDGSLFDVDEWRFFLDDALGRINPGGHLHLRLNPLEHAGGLRPIDPAFGTLIGEYGGAAKGGQVDIYSLA